MSRETKVGLIVATCFVSLIGGVLAVKYWQDQPGATKTGKDNKATAGNANPERKPAPEPPGTPPPPEPLPANNGGLVFPNTKPTEVQPFGLPGSSPSGQLPPVRDKLPPLPNGNGPMLDPLPPLPNVNAPAFNNLPPLQPPNAQPVRNSQVREDDEMQVVRSSSHPDLRKQPQLQTPDLRGLPPTNILPVRADEPQPPKPNAPPPPVVNGFDLPNPGKKDEKPTKPNDDGIGFTIAPPPMPMTGNPPPANQNINGPPQLPNDIKPLDLNLNPPKPIDLPKPMFPMDPPKPETPKPIDSGLQSLPKPMDNGLQIVPKPMDNGPPPLSLPTDTMPPAVPKPMDNGLQLPPKPMDNGLQLPPKPMDNGLQLPPKPMDNATTIVPPPKPMDNIGTLAPLPDNLNNLPPAPPPVPKSINTNPLPGTGNVNLPPLPNRPAPAALLPPTMDNGPRPFDNNPPAAVQPAQSAELRSDQYYEDWYTAVSGDTFESLSQKNYYTTKYAQALRQYNKDRNGLDEVRAGATVRIPPARVLERKHPADVPGVNPAPGSSRNPSGAAPAAVGMPQGLTDPVNAVRSSPDSGLEYTVRKSPNTLRDIAKETLGSSDKWNMIFRLNRWLNPDQPIPEGTRLRMPSDAQLP
jgi:hypothetical protein